MPSSDFSINLVWLSTTTPLPKWKPGQVYTCQNTPLGISEVLERSLASSHADAWLFWDPTLGSPPALKILTECLSGPADGWHAGLRLGMGGQPEIIDFITPTWMLNKDPEATIDATSWRLSLRACLIRADVIRQLGGPDPSFKTLMGASLELGYRFIRYGAFVRHVPSLVSTSNRSQVKVPMEDQWRFIKIHFGKQWQVWAGLRSVLLGKIELFPLVKSLSATRHCQSSEIWKPYQHFKHPANAKIVSAKISVLIPTVNRYPYLRKLLGQLRTQTKDAFEIIVVDQTPKLDRDVTIPQDFADLPLIYITVEKAGQCSSRNLGIKNSKGDWIIFLDDDIEVSKDFIATYIKNLNDYRSKVMSGVIYEKNFAELSSDFQFVRISNVFPGGNSILAKSVLFKTGLFDLAYDQGQRADHDLGMRLYLAGEMLVLIPSIALLHHHAPMGGLREHKARVKTYAASRAQLFNFNLPTGSDLYLNKRYFSPEQLREQTWISLIGTLSNRGGWAKRVAKVLIGLCCLPLNIWRIHLRSKKADAILENYPQIPSLPENQTP
jgi:GT2 family glycosyltransferase